MKERICVLLIAALIVTLGGCGQSGGAAAGFSGEDLYLVVEGTQYRLGASIQEVLDDLGEDYEYAEGKSCDYDGLDKTYLYKAAEFYTWPMAGGDLINEIYTQDPAVATSKGLFVGAARDEILAAYGADCEDTGYQLIYRLPDGEGGSLCFDLENDVVTAIYITAQPI